MLTREVNPSHRSAHVREEIDHLSGLEPGGGPPGPSIFVPALRDATLEIFAHTRVYLLDLIHRIVDALTFRHGSDATRLISGHEGGKDAARPLLIACLIRDDGRGASMAASPEKP